MTRLDQFQIVEHFKTYGGDFIVCRPVIALNFYFAKSTSEVGSAVADAIEIYLDAIPKNALASFKKTNGEDGPLTPRTLRRDLSRLRAPDASLMELRYHSGPPANIGAYGVLFNSNVLKPHLPTFTNILRFELPPEHEIGLDDRGPSSLMEKLAGQLPYHSGFAGYALAYLDAFENRVYEILPGVLMRFIGMDPGYTRTYRFIRNATPDAHWITLLDDELLKPLGGRDGLAEAIPSAQIRDLSRGVLVRSAAVPPIGDVNRGAKDIGVLPDLARFMRPSRLKIPHMFHDDFDPELWLSRFDDRPSGPWDNRT